MDIRTGRESGVGRETGRQVEPVPPLEGGASHAWAPAIQAEPGGRLQVLSTEHWSLLTTRSLAYSESFSRVELFLALLTGAVVALALLAQVDRHHEVFTLAAVLLLSIVLFAGLATVGRLTTLNQEDVRCVLGMNRLRRAYLDLYPELEPYFLAGSHDDLQGVMLTMNMDMAPGRRRPADALHGLQTLPAMLGTIVAVVAGVLSGLVAAWLGAGWLPAVAVACGVFSGCAVLLWLLTRRSFDLLAARLPARFPSEESAARPPTSTKTG
jgi:hypothetical protein